VLTPFRITLLVTAIALAAPALGQDGLLWRTVDLERTVIMELDTGRVVLELNPTFAPQTVERFVQLVRSDFYRGLSFYRVIEGFVAQAGDESDIDQPGSQPGLPAEFEIEWDPELPWTPVQKPDLFAAETGFIDGFAAAREDDRAWLAHCPGVLAMARGEAADSGSTDFYIVIGQAPRYLDRNLTVFGRVIDGMQAVQSIRRGLARDNGVIADDLGRSRILRMRMADQLSRSERNTFLVQDTSRIGFRDILKGRRERKEDFFHHRPPAVLDVCQVPVSARVEKPDSAGRQPRAGSPSQ
jgi:peptidylprolyl isomerase